MESLPLFLSLSAIGRAGVLALRRITNDPEGRSAFLITSGAATALIALCWAASQMIPQLVQRELLERRLGIGATAVTFADGRTPTLEDVRLLWSDPRVLVTCERTGTVITPDANRMPVRVIATTPSYFRFRALRAERGRTLRWVDTLPFNPRIVVGTALRHIAPEQLIAWGGTPQVIGVLRDTFRANEDLTVVTLLRGSRIDDLCGGAAIRELRIVAAPGVLHTTVAQVQGKLAANPQGAVHDVQITAELAPRLQRIWNGSYLGVERVLRLLAMLVAMTAVATLVVQMRVRAHARRFEIGVARAVGATAGALTLELIVETMLLTLFASALGGCISAAVTWITSAALDTTMPSPSLFVVAGLTVVAAATAAAVQPLRAVTRSAPMVGLNADAWQ